METDKASPLFSFLAFLGRSARRRSKILRDVEVTKNPKQKAFVGNITVPIFRSLVPLYQKLGRFNKRDMTNLENDGLATFSWGI